MGRNPTLRGVRVIPITFFVQGLAVAQPRPRAFAVRLGSKWTSRVFNPHTADNWKAAISDVAKHFALYREIDGPIELRLEFWLPRPRSHWRTGKRSHLLRPDVPTYVTGKPDVDNLVKSTMDALNDSGLWRDDSQVVRVVAVKKYAGGNNRPGCGITICKPFDMPTTDAYEQQVKLAIEEKAKQ